jgi:hypothetical protein
MGSNSPSRHKAQVPYDYVNAIGNGGNNQRSGPTNEKSSRPQRTYDILPDSRTNIFKWLREEGVAKPLEGWKPKLDPLPSNWDHGKFCEYHNHSGHTTEDCLSLKNYLQNLIEKGVLERGVKPGSNGPLVVNNPLPEKQVNMLRLEEKGEREEAAFVVITEQTPSLPVFVTPTKERNEQSAILDCNMIDNEGGTSSYYQKRCTLLGSG